MRPVTFTEAGIRRAIKAARKAGLRVKEIRQDGTVLTGPRNEPQPATGYDWSEWRNGLVYFIECGEFIKIGFTDDLNRRFDALQAANPHTLTVLATIPGTLGTEHELHRKFSSARHTGEWFRKTDELLAFIEQQKALST